MILLIICVLLVVIILFILFRYVKGLSDYIDKSKPQIELIYLVASLATIIALIVAIGVYYEERNIIEENNRFIVENLNQEIINNLGDVTYLSENLENFKEGINIPLVRFNYWYLEKSTDIIKDKKVREDIIVTIHAMKQANTLMNQLVESRIIYYNEGREAYLTVVSNNIDTLEEFNNLTKVNLEIIQKHLGNSE